MSSLEIDYSPRILWRLQRGEHVMETRLIPHAQYGAVVILVDGQRRAAEAFEHQTDALRWAEERRVINAEAACSPPGSRQSWRMPTLTRY